MIDLSHKHSVFPYKFYHNKIKISTNVNNNNHSNSKYTYN
jgi:hypothetical protein